VELHETLLQNALGLTGLLLLLSLLGSFVALSGKAE
jgi:hypothetical protein